jgi:hypothetical protein
MDISKLNFNWGGAGYDRYDGRMEDNAGEGVMDSQGRTEAALAAFNGDEGKNDEQDTEQGDGKTVLDGQQGEGEGEGQAAGEGAAGEGEGEGAAGQLTDEQRQADPVFQELTEFQQHVNEVFDKVRHRRCCGS